MILFTTIIVWALNLYHFSNNILMEDGDRRVGSFRGAIILKMLTLLLL